jgi:hypothetical protein
MIEEAAARTNVRINVPRVGGVLPPVSQLVAVGIQNWIETQRLNDFLPGANAGNKMTCARRMVSRQL